MEDDFRIRPPRPPADRSDIVQYMSLSLMILLLAFFIVLNAISSFQADKISPRLDSIDRTFATKAKGGESFPARVAAPASKEGSGEVFDLIEETLKSQGIPFEAQRLSGNSALFVRLPEERFMYLTGTATNDRQKNEKSVFLGKLVMLTMPASASVPRHHMRVMIATGDSPARLAKDDATRFADRVALADRIAGRLAFNGLDPASLSIGLAPGKTGFVDIYFETKAPAVKASEGEAP